LHPADAAQPTPAIRENAVSFKVPTDIARLSDAELADLIAEGNAEFDALLGLENPSDQDVVEAERISPLVRQLTAESERRNSAASSRVERMNALRTAHSDAPADTEETSTEDPAETETGTEVEAAVATVELRELHQEDLVQAADESDDAFARRRSRYPSNGTTAAAPPEVEIVDKADAVVTTLPRIPRPVRPERRDGDMVITAAADVPDFSAGSSVEGIEQIAQMAVNRMRGFPGPAGDPNGQVHQYGVCTIRPNFPDELICGRGEDDFTVVERAKREARLPGGSLVAAGGWCAPSETLYALCESETNQGFVSIPEVQVTRGGIRYTSGPDFGDIYDNSGFCYTEAEIIAGVTKPCYDVPCPSFTEVRLDACGTCVRVPILTNAAYPELVQRIIRGALIAFAQQMNSKVLASMETLLGAATPITGLGSTFADTLSALELVTDAIRQRYRHAPNETMEVVLPVWAQGAIQNDLANRMGIDPLSVTDDLVNRALAGRHLSVQWVYGWQELDTSDGVCLDAYPDTVKIMVYPAGTFVKGAADVITLNAVYDAASLATNHYTGLFTEQGILVTKTCFEGCVLEIPLCGAGRTGAADFTCGTG